MYDFLYDLFVGMWLIYHTQCDTAFPFSALTLLVGRQEGHSTFKKLGVDLLLVMI